MTASLGFIVFGVPRSGTSGLAGALNLQPDVYCTHERQFAHAPPAAAGARLQAWLDAPHDPAAARRRRKHEAVQAILAAGGTVAFGDKLPGYYLRLPQVEAMHPGLRQLCIFRPARGFAASWDVRADRADGVAWHPGRCGLFGIFEMLFLMHALAGSRGTTQVLSYEAFFFGQDDLVERLVGDLAGVPAAPGLRRDFVATYFRKKPGATPADGPYDALLRRMEVAEIDDLVLRRRLAPAAELAEAFARFVRHAWPLALEATPALVAGMPAPRQAAVAAYGATWLDVRRRQLDRPDPVLAAGLEALGGLFGG